MRVLFPLTSTVWILLLMATLLASCEETPAPTSIASSPAMTATERSAFITDLQAQRQMWTDDTPADSMRIVHAQLATSYAAAQAWDSTYVYALKVYRHDLAAKAHAEGIAFFNTIIQHDPAPPDTIAAKIIHWSGWFWYQQGKTAPALQAYQEATNVWLKYPLNFRLLDNYNMLGILYMNTGEHTLAESMYKVALPQAESLRDTFIWRRLHNNLGRNYLGQGRLDEAIEQYQAAEALDPKADGYFEYSIATILVDAQQYERAFMVAQEALLKNQSYQGATYLSPAEIRWIIGNIHTARGEHSEAQNQFQRALEIALDDLPPGHRQIGKAYLFLGDAYAQNGLSRLALDSYHQAMGTFLPATRRTTSTYCPPMDSLFSREFYLLDVFQGKGNVLLELFQATNDLEYLQHATAHYQTMLEFVNQIKLQYTEASAKTFFGRYAQPYAAQAIKAHLLLHQENTDTTYLNQAYYLARQATAFLLRDQVGEQQALAIANVPNDTISLLQDTKEAILSLQESLNGESNDSLQTLLWTQKNEYRSLLTQIETQYPRYYELKYNLQPAPLASLQAQLDTNELAINYFLADTVAYVFAFNQDRLEVTSFSVDSTFTEALQVFRQTVADLDYIRANPAIAESQFLRTSQYLYQEILAEALALFDEQEIDQLLLIPDGVLNFIPFECLLQNPTDSWLNTEEFLIQDYDIRYAYYADLLLQNDSARESDNRLLGFGTTYNTQTLKSLNLPQADSIQNPALQDALRGLKLSELLYAEEEIKQVNKIVSGRTFLGADATKANFMTHSPDFDLIHVAAHSFVDDEKDSLAYLAFQQNTEGEDFLLSLADIYGLQLDAELIALSSCQTSLGALEPGEGVMSLARAFHTAGAESMIASQWSISDRSSYQIMTNFYGHLREGKSKPAALRQAKLDYLHNDLQSSPAYRLPAYWAPLVFIGAPDPLELAAPLSTWPIGALVIACLGLLGIWWYFRSRP